MTHCARKSVPFSDLLRHPSETIDRLNRTRAVRLHRRDVADLVLMTAERANAETEIVKVASQLLVKLGGCPRIARRVAIKVRLSSAATPGFELRPTARRKRAGHSSEEIQGGRSRRARRPSAVPATPVAAPD